MQGSTDVCAIIAARNGADKQALLRTRCSMANLDTEKLAKQLTYQSQNTWLVFCCLQKQAYLLFLAYVKHACFLLENMARKKKPENPEDMPPLQRLREAANLTQAQLASRIPDKTRSKTLSRQVISGWERGEYEPELTIPQMKALCRALGVVLEDLPDDLGPLNKSLVS